LFDFCNGLSRDILTHRAAAVELVEVDTYSIAISIEPLPPFINRTRMNSLFLRLLVVVIFIAAALAGKAATVAAPVGM